MLSSIQIGSISTFCPPGIFFGLGVLADSQLYQVFMC